MRPSRLVLMRLRLLTAVFVAALGLCALSLSAAAKQPRNIITPNPADDPQLISERMDPVQYDGGGNCVRKDPKGMKALIKWMQRNTKKNIVYGTIRCDGGVHGTGRALDWTLDAREKSQKRLAMTVINTWMADDNRGRNNALARRMGIQLIIYNCRYWQAGDNGWSPYSACGGRNPDPTQGHIDHVHIELTKAAAGLHTSYWEAGAPGGGGGGIGGTGGGIGGA